MATWCKELTHLKRPWCWEGLRAGGEEDDGGWDGWLASLTLWTWVWVNSGSWWWTGRPGVLRFTVSQRVRHNWATELNWTELSLWCTSLTVQWLRHHFPMQGMWVQFLARELRSPHGLWSKKKTKNKTENRNSISTNSVKTLKMIHVKIIFKNK